MALRWFAIVATALAVLPAAMVRADDRPTPRAGLWESRLQSPGGGEAMVIKQCMDGKVDLEGLMQATGGLCELKWKRIGPDRVETDTSCKVGPVTVTGKGLVIGDFNSKLRIETTSTTTMEGMPAGAPALGVSPEPQKMVVEASWLGPCQPGQKAGDVIMPNGNVMQMPALPNR